MDDGKFLNIGAGLAGRLSGHPNPLARAVDAAEMNLEAPDRLQSEADCHFHLVPGRPLWGPISHVGCLVSRHAFSGRINTYLGVMI